MVFIKVADTHWQINFQNDGAILRSKRLGREEARVQHPTYWLSQDSAAQTGGKRLLVGVNVNSLVIKGSIFSPHLWVTFHTPRLLSIIFKLGKSLFSYQLALTLSILRKTVTYLSCLWKVFNSLVTIILFGVVCSVAQSCLTLCDPMDYSLTGSSVHGIFQARILQRVGISSSRGSLWPRDRTRVSCVFLTESRFFTAEPSGVGRSPLFGVIFMCRSCGFFLFKYSPVC